MGLATKGPAIVAFAIAVLANSHGADATPLMDPTFEMKAPGYVAVTVPGSVEFPGGSTSQGQSDGFAMADPSVPAVSVRSLNGSSISSSLEYFYDISGPTNALVPISVSYSISIVGLGNPLLPFGIGGFQATAETAVESQNAFTVEELTGLFSGPGCVVLTCVVNGLRAGPNTPASQVQSGTLSLTAQANIPYQIVLGVNAFQIGFGEVRVFADPYIEIDPSFLADNPGFAVEVSLGISNAPISAVPEPASIAIFAVALAGLQMRRRSLGDASSAKSRRPHVLGPALWGGTHFVAPEPC